MISELSTHEFSWIRWRRGEIFSLIGSWRETTILQNRRILQAYAVGFCPGEKLLVRPKEDCMGIMFFINGHHEWCHITKKEFEDIFEA